MMIVVSIVTKIRILKQITTGWRSFKVNPCCIYSNKDKNFKANHNSNNHSNLIRKLYL